MYVQHMPTQDRKNASDWIALMHTQPEATLFTYLHGRAYTHWFML